MARAVGVLFVLMLVVVVVAIGCGQGGAGLGPLSGPGTVRHFAVEGGGFEIVNSSGTVYLPDNLTPDFQVDGLRVHFEAHLTGAASSQQVGPLIHVDEIHRIP